MHQCTQAYLASGGGRGQEPMASENGRVEFLFFITLFPPSPPFPTDPVYPSFPVHLSSIAWLFIIISVVCTPHFIIFCLMLFILLREQGFLLSLCGIYFFKTVSLFFGYHHAKEQLAVFFCRFFSSKDVRFRRKLELNCSLVGPELTAVARGSAPPSHTSRIRRKKIV